MCSTSSYTNCECVWQSGMALENNITARKSKYNRQQLCTGEERTEGVDINKRDERRAVIGGLQWTEDHVCSFSLRFVCPLVNSHHMVTVTSQTPTHWAPSLWNSHIMRVPSSLQSPALSWFLLNSFCVALVSFGQLLCSPVRSLVNWWSGWQANWGDCSI